jgi:hypothetical protein
VQQQPMPKHMRPALLQQRQQAGKTARAAIAAAEAAAALREEDADDRDGAQPRGPHRHHNVSPSPV